MSELRAEDWYNPGAPFLGRTLVPFVLGKSVPQADRVALRPGPTSRNITRRDSDVEGGNQ